MRTWTVRTIAKTGSDHMELEFPTTRSAQRFAVDWFLENPNLIRIEMVDGAGRSDPLILDRRRVA